MELFEDVVFNAFCRPTGEDFPSPTGDKMAPKYEMAIDSNGHKTLVQNGETNIYEIIQESLEGSKIENIIKRIMGGDFSDIRNGGVYMDTTELPKSLMEMQNLTIKMENAFMKLPLEERAKYNHNVGEYLKSLDEKLAKAVENDGRVQTVDEQKVSEGTERGTSEPGTN